jgi:DNA-binding transcriptional LysR family regulator
MERFDLASLRFFVSVAEEGNIAHTAAREHIAASAISKRLQELETELDTPLFRRHQKGVELTPAGEALLIHARNVFAVLNRMRDEMGEYGRGTRGHVRVSANTSSIVQFLPETLKRFVSLYPHVKIQLHEEVSEVTVRMVRDGVVDLGLIASFVPAEGLDLVPFRTDRVCVLVRNDHPLASRESVWFEETFPYDHVGLEERSSLQLMIFNAAAERNHPLSLRVRVASFDALRRLVQAGVGIGFLPEECIRPYEQSMGLKAVLLFDQWSHRSLSVCARDKDFLPVTARLLLQELLK